MKEEGGRRVAGHSYREGTIAQSPVQGRTRRTPTSRAVMGTGSLGQQKGWGSEMHR